MHCEWDHSLVAFMTEKGCAMAKDSTAQRSVATGAPTKKIRVGTTTLLDATLTRHLIRENAKPSEIFTFHVFYLLFVLVPAISQIAANILSNHGREVDAPSWVAQPISRYWLSVVVMEVWDDCFVEPGGCSAMKGESFLMALYQIKYGAAKKAKGEA